MDLSAPRSRPPLRRVVGTGPELLARVGQRADALAGLGTPTVLAPSAVAADARGRVVVELPAVDGMDLAELATSRAPLSAAECAWLARRLGDALTSMHAAGLAHGDIAPANVALTAHGVALLDTIGGCLDDERGTPGFRAPERDRGATLPGDVYSLGALLRWAVCERDRPLVEAWTSPLLVPDPAERPPAQVAARALSRLAPEVAPARPASADVAAAARARAAPRTERIPAGRWWRARRHVERAGAVLGVTVGAAAIILGVPRLVDGALAEPASIEAGSFAAGGSDAMVSDAMVSDVDGSEGAGSDVVRSGAPASESADGPERPGHLRSVTDGWAVPAAVSVAADLAVVTRRDDPMAAAVALTEARIDALRRADGDALRGLVSSSPPAAELTATIGALASRLDAGTLRYAGLDLEIQSALVRRHDEGETTVALTYRIGPHTVEEDGAVTRVAGRIERVLMALRWEGRWTVASVTADA
ncbi:hypothetical protein [Demequina sp. NBRC 110056]|uniref:hypothetical protein n=1 Tax=Demequina sp. NBRC 110056 TaxID=1570345 RepID=UPI00117DEFB9|nr:hypothetical protein [Demequina sp. NBRC 110056]